MKRTHHNVIPQLRTLDITTSGMTPVGTQAMGDAVVAALME